jgi:hypothetical protein
MGSRELGLAVPPGAERPGFLSAASGLVRSGDELYVVTDDELHLGRFAATGARLGTLVRLFEGRLPPEPKARKKRKADLEILLRLPPLPAFERGALLALGSGSTSRRRRGALVELDWRGHARGTGKAIDAAPLFEGLERQFHDLNLEGGWVDGDAFCLLQRGNKGNSPNAVIELDYAAVAAALSGDKVLPDIRPRRITEVDLGDIRGIPLGFTDACMPAPGLWLFSAVAEDTKDSVADGACMGAVVGLATREQGIVWQRRLAPTHKIEGIEARLVDGQLSILCVTDADDPAVPAKLLRASAELRAGD